MGNLKLIVLTMFALLATSSGIASAQTPITRAGRSSIELFQYGWDGGITITPDGHAQMADYPTVKALGAGSAAAEAGLRVSDVIVAVNGQDARLPPLFNDLRVGSRVVLQVRRDGLEREIAFTARAVQKR
jgi:C-terminal processing protease CtpA/Prc